MSEDEEAILNLLADVWNKFCLLPSYHPYESIEFMTAIHAAQLIIMARVAIRENPKIFYVNESKNNE